MVSVEFYLAKITPGSPWNDPREMNGGIPAITEEDVLAAVSMATQPAIYAAMMAKYCQDRRNAERLVHFTAKRSAIAFLEKYPTWRITGKINQGIAESAVLFYLNPAAGHKRGDAGNAAHLRVDPKTWRKYYRNHWKAQTSALFELEIEGLRAIGRRLR